MAQENEIWTEKYRPMTIQNLIGMDDKIPQIEAFLQKKSLPHLLFVGPPGTGKTSTILSLLHDLFREHFNSNVEEINANDSRDYLTRFKRKWFEVALNEYKRKNSGSTPPLNYLFKSIFRNFSMMRTFSDVPFRVLILKDADDLTMDIQQALRRIMEKSTRTCRFCLICENLSKIIDPIRSRCVILHFTPLKESYISAILRYIVSAEKISIENAALSAIIHLGKGNLTRTINLLQTITLVQPEKTLNADLVHQVAKQFIIFKVKEMLALALNQDFLGARTKLRELFIQYGLTGVQITDQIRDLSTKLPIPMNWKIIISDLLGEYEHRMQRGSNEEIHLSTFISQLGILKLD